MTRDHHQSSFTTRSILLEQDADFPIKKLYRRNPKKAKKAKTARNSQPVASSQLPVAKRGRPPKLKEHTSTAPQQHSSIDDLVYAIAGLGCVSAVVLLASSVLIRSLKQSLNINIKVSK